MKRILIPCDFSEQSDNACRFAIHFGHTSSAEIHLLHVVELPFLHDTLLMPTLSFEEERFRDLRDLAETKLEDIATKYSVGQSKLKSAVLFGAPSKKILEYISEHGIDLVVMGTKGVSGIREIFVGSNTEKIVRASGVPVIAVKDNVKPRQIKNIVFPNVIEPDSNEDLVMKVKDLQHSLGAHLHIVYINTPLNFRKDLVSRDSLSHFVKRYMLKDCTTAVFNDTEEEAGIVNFTKMIDADMIAVGTHGRKGLAHLLSGSIAEDLVNHSNLPIWTYTIKSGLI